MFGRSRVPPCQGAVGVWLPLCGDGLGRGSPSCPGGRDTECTPGGGQPVRFSDVIFNVMPDKAVGCPANPCHGPASVLCPTSGGSPFSELHLARARSLSLTVCKDFISDPRAAAACGLSGGNITSPRLPVLPAARPSVQTGETSCLPCSRDSRDFQAGLPLSTKRHPLGARSHETGLLCNTYGCCYLCAIHRAGGGAEIGTNMSRDCGNVPVLLAVVQKERWLGDPPTLLASGERTVLSGTMSFHLRSPMRLQVLASDWIEVPRLTREGSKSGNMPGAWNPKTMPVHSAQHFT